jgi:hypothetical protein
MFFLLLLIVLGIFARPYCPLGAHLFLQYWSGRSLWVGITPIPRAICSSHRPAVVLPGRLG